MIKKLFVLTMLSGCMATGKQIRTPNCMSICTKVLGIPADQIICTMSNDGLDVMCAEIVQVSPTETMVDKK